MMKVLRSSSLLRTRVGTFADQIQLFVANAYQSRSRGPNTLVCGGCSNDVNILQFTILSQLILGRLLTHLGKETIGLPSKYNRFNMDSQLKSIGKDSVDKLLFARDNFTKDLGKEIVKNLKSLGIPLRMSSALSFSVQSISLILIRDSPTLHPFNNNVLTFFKIPMVLGSFPSLLQ